MKSILFFVLLTGMTFSTFAQSKSTSVQVDESQVPQVVKDNFTKAFGATPVTKWMLSTIQRKDKTFERYIAVFTKDGLNHKARFLHDGKEVNYSIHYDKEQMPAVVKTGISALYPDFEAKACELVYSYRQNTEVYRVRLRKETAKLVVYLDAEGKELKGKQVPDDINDRDSE